MIYLQDCTLSDGGRASGGRFDDLVERTLSDTVKAGSRYVEIGTLCRKEYHADFTNYNYVMQANALLEEKAKSVRYGVCIESNAFALIDRLPNFVPEGIDFIRVVFQRDKLSEALACCKTIIDRGYRVMVHPLCMSLYSKRELTACINAFAPLSLEAFLIDDSFGAFSADDLQQKLQIAEQAFSSDTAIGFCGRNYLYRQTELMQVLAEAADTRTIIVHATAGGFGKPGHCFSCEVVAQFLNEHHTPAPYCVERYMAVTQRLYNRYGVSMNPLMTVTAAKILTTVSANCDPSWGLYSTQTRYPISDEQFPDFIAQLSRKQKQHADEEDYEDAARQFFQKQWNKKLAVIVPTANRPESIRYYLQQVGKAHEFYGIDLIFYDSSSNDETERIIEEFTEGECEHIIYERYTGGFDGITIDEKGTTAYSVFSKRYKYVWMSRDSWVIDIASIQKELFHYIRKLPDAIVLYSPGEDEKHIGYREYTDCAELFRDSCCHMSILGATIFSSEFMRRVLQNQPLDNEKNYGMYQPIAMFAQWASQPMFVISQTINYYYRSIYSSDISFWNKNGRALWQWGENWYSLIHGLPSVYDTAKPDIYKFHIVGFTPFKFAESLIMRTTGSLTCKKVKQYAEYLPLVSDHSLNWFYAVSIIPKFVCRAMLTPKSRFGKGMNWLVHTYSFLKRFNEYPQPLPENYDISAFDTGEKNNGIIFADNDLCILFPVRNRGDILRDNLERSLTQYEAYHIPVIVYDASTGNEIKNFVCDELVRCHSNIRYVRYEGDVDAFSDDEFIISAYSRFSHKYRYLWLVRDICLINLKTCVYQIWQAIADNKDIIIFSRENIDRVDKLLFATEYNDACNLFHDTFSACLFPENMILKSVMVATIMHKQPLGEINQGFWRTAALFHYIAKHPFSAVVIAAEAFCYHPSTLLEAQESNSLWQWVDRLYTVFDMLPKEYADEREFVLRRLDQVYCFVRPARLLRVRIAGGYRLRDVYQYGQNVAFVSGTSFSQLVKIGLVPKFLAKLMIARPTVFLWRHLLFDINTDKIGDY